MLDQLAVALGIKKGIAVAALIGAFLGYYQAPAPDAAPTESEHTMHQQD